MRGARRMLCCVDFRGYRDLVERSTVISITLVQEFRQAVRFCIRLAQTSAKLMKRPLK